MSENRGLIAVVVILLLALVGLVCVGVGALVYCPQPGSICGGLFGNTNVASNPPPQPNATTAPGVPTRIPATRAPSGGNGGNGSGANVLHLPGGTGGGGDPPTLDPANTSDVESATYIVEIYSGLVSFNKDLKIVPEIAESWKTSPDGKTYTFTL